MNQTNTKSEIKILAIDLAKNSFQLHGVNNKGYQVFSKKMERKCTCHFYGKFTQLFSCNGGLW